MLLIVGLTLALLEALLGACDPLGIRYLRQLNGMAAYYTGDISQYRLAPGHYNFGDWEASVNAVGQRVVPNAGMGCTLAFFGDSLTWGWGVQDAESYVNRLARRWPDARVVNAAQIGYNSAQVRLAIAQTDFDRGVYLIVKNDATGAFPFGGQHPAGQEFTYPGFGLLRGGEAASPIYARWILHTLNGSIYLEQPDDLPRFYDDLGAIAARGDVQLFAFDEPLGRLAAQRYPVTLLPLYPTVLSAADSHPDSAGHAWIAGHMAVLRPC